MSARGRMTMRARVEQLRAIEGGAPIPADDWGDPGIPGTSTQWETKIDALPCWFWTSHEREATGPDSTKVVEDLWMIVPKAADVREQDRVNGVVDRIGRTVREGRMIIESVVSHRQFQTLHLIGIESGG